MNENFNTWKRNEIFNQQNKILYSILKLLTFNFLISNIRILDLQFFKLFQLTLFDLSRKHDLQIYEHYQLWTTLVKLRFYTEISNLIKAEAYCAKNVFYILVSFII